MPIDVFKNIRMACENLPDVLCWLSNLVDPMHPADAVGVAVIAVSTLLLGVARTLQVDLRKVA